MLYEVDDKEAVPRLIELFQDGRIERDSIENDPGPWGDIPCLVHGTWSDMKKAVPNLNDFVVPKAEFVALWIIATDRVHTPLS